MRFMSIRDLRANTKRLREVLDGGREVVITANGQPFALMTRLNPDRIEEELLAIRRARARAALSRAQSKAKTEGRHRMTAEQIDDVVARTRRDRRTAG